MINMSDSTTSIIENKKDASYIKLTMDGINTVIESLDIEFVNPCPIFIRELVDNMVSTYELPKTNDDGVPIQYMLGLENKYDGEDAELIILEFTDDEGNELTLSDYDVKPDAHFHLIGVLTVEIQPQQPQVKKKHSIVYDFLHKIIKSITNH